MPDRVVIKNIMGIKELDVSFEFPSSNLLVVTGKNGVGKTTLVKALRVLDEPDVFKNTSSYKAISAKSEIHFEIEGFSDFSFTYNKEQGVMDSKDTLPSDGILVAELPIPGGKRFKHFEALFSRNAEIEAKNAAQDYSDANDLIAFLHKVYGGNKFESLKAVDIGTESFYFIPRDDGTYLREDNLSSGEYFLIQIFKLITSGAKLIIIDELDVALDASAQVKLFESIKPVLENFGSRLVVISHSLAFMQTVGEGGLYYLEESGGNITLELRSFGYIKSDLYGFKGFDRYILTEDLVLEGFIEFVITYHSITPYFQHTTIGVAGVTQVRKLVEKNDIEHIFSEPENVMAIVDGDTCDELKSGYTGETKMFCSPVEDIEKYISLNRNLLTDVPPPTYKEKQKVKDASKKYWEYLTVDKSISRNRLYQIVVDNHEAETNKLADEIRQFLVKD